MGQNLGEFEQLVLLALIRLEDDAYGVSVRQEIEQRTGRRVTLGTVYKTLLRLEEKELVTAHFGPPTKERGGRRKKLYQVEGGGRAALVRSVSAIKDMAQGLDPLFDNR
ncbi:MAG: helix-turn-helix transcriptional regulator [Gemmatimonadota bacterium]